MPDDTACASGKKLGSSDGWIVDDFVFCKTPRDVRRKKFYMKRRECHKINLVFVQQRPGNFFLLGPRRVRSTESPTNGSFVFPRDPVRDPGRLLDDD